MQHGGSQDGSGEAAVLPHGVRADAEKRRDDLRGIRAMHHQVAIQSGEASAGTRYTGVPRLDSGHFPAGLSVPQIGLASQSACYVT